MKRAQALQLIVDRILDTRVEDCTRVGIDGISAAGKTTLANELAVRLQGLGETVRRVSADDFHNPEAIRYRRGRESPEGYYLDAIDNESLRASLLTPSDASVVIADGVFLFRPELNDCWHFRVHIEITVQVALDRGPSRDGERMGGTEAVMRLYERRYLPGERLYLESVRPAELADLVFDNNVPENPHLQFRGDLT